MVLIRKHFPSNLCKCASYKRADPLSRCISPRCSQQLHISENGKFRSVRSLLRREKYFDHNETPKNGN
jgi:hypothetical protein